MVPLRLRRSEPSAAHQWAQDAARLLLAPPQPGRYRERIRAELNEGAALWPAEPDAAWKLRRALASELDIAIDLAFKQARYREVDKRLATACGAVEATLLKPTGGLPDALVPLASVAARELRWARRRLCLRTRDAALDTDDTEYARQTLRLFRRKAATVPFVLVHTDGQHPGFTVDLHVIQLSADDIELIEDSSLQAARVQEAQLWVGGTPWTTPPALDALGLGNLGEAKPWLILLVDVPAAPLEGLEIQDGSYGLAAALGVDCVTRKARLSSRAVVGGKLAPDGGAIGSGDPTIDLDVARSKAAIALREGFNRLIYALPEDKGEHEKAARAHLPPANVDGLVLVHTAEEAREQLRRPGRKRLFSVLLALICALAVVLGTSEYIRERDRRISREERIGRLYNDCVAAQTLPPRRCLSDARSLWNELGESPVDWKLRAVALTAEHSEPAAVAAFPRQEGFRLASSGVYPGEGRMVLGRYRVPPEDEAWGIPNEDDGVFSLENLESLIVVDVASEQPFRRFPWRNEWGTRGLAFGFYEDGQRALHFRATRKSNGGDTKLAHFAFAHDKIEQQGDPIPFEETWFPLAASGSFVVGQYGRDGSNTVELLDATQRRWELVDGHAAVGAAREGVFLLSAPSRKGSGNDVAAPTSTALVPGVPGARVWILGKDLDGQRCGLASPDDVICFGDRVATLLRSDGRGSLRRVDTQGLFAGRRILATSVPALSVWSGPKGFLHSEVVLNSGNPGSNDCHYVVTVAVEGDHLKVLLEDSIGCPLEVTRRFPSGFTHQRDFHGILDDVPAGVRVPRHHDFGDLFSLSGEHLLVLDADATLYAVRRPKGLSPRSDRRPAVLPASIVPPSISASSDGEVLWRVRNVGPRAPRELTVFSTDALGRGATPTHAIGSRTTIAPNGLAAVSTRRMPLSEQVRQAIEFTYVSTERRRASSFELTPFDGCLARAATSFGTSGLDVVAESGEDENRTRWLHFASDDDVEPLVSSLPIRSTERAIAAWNDTVFGIALRTVGGDADDRAAVTEWIPVGWQRGSNERVVISEDSCRLNDGADIILRQRRALAAVASDGSAFLFGVRGCGWLSNGSKWQRVHGKVLDPASVTGHAESGACRLLAENETATLSRGGLLVSVRSSVHIGAFDVAQLVADQYIPAPILGQGVTWHPFENRDAVLAANGRSIRVFLSLGDHVAYDDYLIPQSLKEVETAAVNPSSRFLHQERRWNVLFSGQVEETRP